MRLTCCSAGRIRHRKCGCLIAILSTAAVCSFSPRYPPLPSLSSIGAACVKLCGLRLPSLDRTTVAAVSSSLQRRKYKVRFDVNMNNKHSVIFSNALDELIQTFAV